MSSSSLPAVLVVGAGPAGLILALSLVKQGVKVRIIEKHASPRIGSRGAGIMPRTLEILGALSTLPDYLKLGRPVPQMRAYKLPGGAEPSRTWDLLAKPQPSSSRPFTSAIELGQDMSEHILHSHLGAYRCFVEFGTELLKLQQDAHGVTAKMVVRKNKSSHQESARFQYVVGADGARGITRKLIGVSFLGERRDADEFIVGDVEVHGLTSDFWHLWKDPASPTSPVVGLRPSPPVPNKFSIFSTGTHFSKDELWEPENFKKFFKEYTGRDDIKFGQFTWLSFFQPNMRMVDKFSVGRVFLVGDAAHVHSPTGGQGMNSSVQDSFNLAWKLALVIKGHAPETLLSSYNEERLPVIAEMLRRTSNVHTKTFAGGELSGQESRGWSRGSELLMLDVNYRWSSIVLDDRFPHSNEENEVLKAQAYMGDGKGLRAGDRTPEAPGLLSFESKEETSLFKFLDMTRHTILIFDSQNGEEKTTGLLDRIGKHFNTTLAQIALVLKPHCQPSDALIDREDLSIFLDKHGHAYKNLSIEGDQFTVIVVRPDGVVGAVVHDAKGVLKYMGLVMRL